MASSRAVDYDALSKTTRIIDITDDARNQKIIQSLILGNPSRLRICEEAYNGREYRPGSSEELGWLGHFAKESANFEEFGIRGSDAFYKCSDQSVNEFFEDLGKCNRIRKFTCARFY